jgi:hypothetical protein
LLYNFSPERNRILLKQLAVTYEKQARDSVTARCTVNPEELGLLTKSIDEEGRVFVSLPVEVRNNKNEIVCLAKVDWQIKRWDLVRAQKPAKDSHHAAS